MSEQHTLKIRINHLEDNPIHADGTMTVQVLCPGVDDHCRLWRACDAEDHDDVELTRIHFEEGDDEPFHHDVRHQYLDGDYMVPTEDCYMLVVLDRVYDAALDLVRGESLGAGDYVVEHRYEEGDLVEFELVRQTYPAGVPAPGAEA